MADRKKITVGHGIESLVLMIEAREPTAHLTADEAEALGMDLIRQAGHVRNSILEGYTDDEPALDESVEILARIERDVRAKVAAELRAEADRVHALGGDYDAAVAAGLAGAAKITEGTREGE